MKNIVLFLSLILCAQSYAWEMVVIKAVSTTQKTFVTQLGVKSGIRHGDQAMFSNSKVNILAKAVEVTRQYTVWAPVDPRVAVPFVVDDLVTYGRSEEMVEAYIPEKEAESDVREIDDGLYKVYHKQEKIDRAQDLAHYFNLRFSLGQGLSETVTDTSTGSASTRSQLEFEAMYGYAVRHGLYLKGGLRLDRETASGDNFESSSTRTYILGGAQIYFAKFRGDYIPYAEILFGFGNSSTDLNGETQDGSARLFPAISLGFEKRWEDTRYIQFEAGVENISIEETKLDNTVQESQQLNGRVSVGIKFLM